MATVFIYALVDPDTVQIRYVGKADDVEARYKVHMQCRDKTHKATWIRSLRRNGKAPVVCILEATDSEGWAERERWWIATLRTAGCDLCNHTEGGDGVPGWRHTEETKAQLSAMHRGVRETDEARAKVSAALKGRPKPEWYKQQRRGIKFSDEHRQHVSEARKGMRFSEEHRRNISKAKRGSTAPNKGKPLSEAQRIAVSATHRKLTNEEVAQVRELLAGNIPVLQVAQQFGVSRGTIYRIRNGYQYKSL